MIFTILQLIFTTTFLYMIGVYFHRKYSRFWQLVENIPEPPGDLWLGHLYQIFTTSEQLFINDRKRSAQYPVIHKLRILNHCSVHLINPDDIELVLSNMKHINKSILYDPLHSWLGSGLLTSTGQKWQTRRKILTPAFHFNILQEFIKIFNEETKTLIKDLEKSKGQAINVVLPITQYTLYSIAKTAMGTDLSNETGKETYKSHIYKMGEYLTYRVTKPWFANDLIYNLTKMGKLQQESVKILHEFSTNVINTRKTKFQFEGKSSYSTRKRLAMLDLLLSYQSEGADIDDEGIREEVDTFMFEGHDTTSVSICYTLMLLAIHKEWQEQIYSEMKEVLTNFEDFPTYNELQELRVMERVLKESLRLYPSVPVISRMSGEDIHTRTGYTIPKDCMINIYIIDLHRDPRLYPDPAKFDPDRFLPENIQRRHPFAYIPFSAGPRNCIGQRFALLELKAVLCGILKKFHLEPVDRPEDLVFITDMVSRTRDGIKVKFVSRT